MPLTGQRNGMNVALDRARDGICHTECVVEDWTPFLALPLLLGDLEQDSEPLRARTSRLQQKDSRAMMTCGSLQAHSQNSVN